MSDENENVQLKVEEEEEPEPVYVAEAEGGDDAAPVEGEGGAQAAIDAVKAGGNPLDAMDGFTLLVALLITSIIVFVAACVAIWGTAGFGSGLNWWAFVGSLLSVIGCIIMIVFKKCCEPQFTAAGPIMMIIFLVLWLAIVFPGTFAGPFTGLSNGWIGCWGSLVLAAALAARAFADKAKALQKAVESQNGSDATKFALFLGIASIIVLIAASVGYSNFACGGSFGLNGYAVALAVISIVAVIIILVVANVESAKQHSNVTNMVISIILIVWWAVGAFVTTFVGPFFGGACSLNGYLGVWICVYACFMLFKACGLATVQGWIAKAKGGAAAGDNAAAGGESSADDTPAL